MKKEKMKQADERLRSASVFMLMELEERFNKIQKENAELSILLRDTQIEELDLEQQNKRYREAVKRAIKEGVTIKDCDEAVNHIYGILGEALEVEE